MTPSTATLMRSIANAASKIENRNLAKSRVICQLHKAKEIAKSRTPNKRLIDKEFDELHTTILNLVRHEKGLLKRQEEDEAYLSQLKGHITNLEFRLKKSEDLLRYAIEHMNKVKEIDEAVNSLYKKVVRTFDLKETEHKPVEIKPDPLKIRKLKKTINALEKRYNSVKGKEKDKAKLKQIKDKIELLKARLG